MENEGQKPGSHISKFEWGLVAGVMLVIDIIQLVLDFFAVGIAVNRFIDIICALTLSFYLKIRRAHMDTRAWASIGATFVGEMIPVLDALPLWTLDVLYIWSINSSGTAAVVTSEALNLGLKKMGKPAIGRGEPPVIATQGKTPPKISSSTPPPIPQSASTTPPPIPRQGPPPLPRRLPPEQGIGEEARPPVIPRQTPPPIPQSARTTPPPIPARPGETPPIIETYGKTPPVITSVPPPIPGRGNINERAEKLRQHAEDFRREIESQTNSYGDTVQKGQDYINATPEGELNSDMSGENEEIPPEERLAA